MPFIFFCGAFGYLFGQGPGCAICVLIASSAYMIFWLTMVPTRQP